MRFLASLKSPFSRLAVAAIALTLTAGCEVGSPPPADGSTSVAEIQGAGHRSPLEGQEIEVAGVVTGHLPAAGGRDGGVWIESPTPDDNLATSEGLFLLTDERPAIGRLVTTRGQVVEVERRRGSTVTALQVSASAGASAFELGGELELPPPQRLGAGGREIPATSVDADPGSFDPASDARDLYESLEGMRVVVNDPVLVGPTSRHGDIAVVADGGRGAGARSARDGVMVSEDDPQPERMVVSSWRMGRMPAFDVGTRFPGPIEGILDFDFGAYRMLPTGLPDPDRASRRVDVAGESTRLFGDETAMTVASFNVLNLHPRSGSDKMQRLARTVVDSLGAPDIVGLQEIQDDSGPEDDGTTTSARTLAALADAVVEAGGPRYEALWLDPVDGADGGAPGANIRNAFLYDPARVQPIRRGSGGRANDRSPRIEGRGAAVSISPLPARLLGPAFDREGPGAHRSATRKPLIGGFRFAGRDVYVIVVHLRSKRADDALFGDEQPPQRRSEPQRIEQARAVHSLVARWLDAAPDLPVIVLGDFNEVPGRAPLQELEEGGVLTNLMDRLPADERYSFNFQGVSQLLDHVFVSPALAADGVAAIDAVHVASDRAADDQPSDHDPLIARFELGR
ncbi:MAG: endonuclease/exonuclease/phosphatase family protein [Acidobacteriota bacterium]